MHKRVLIKKISLITKFMTSQIITHYQHILNYSILPNISRGKSNQTKKYGQLIEYNKRNIFLQIPYRKCDKETSSRLF